MTKVTVITTTVRGWDFLKKQLADLEAQTLPDIQWVIKDERRDERDWVITSSKIAVRYTPPGEGVVDYFAPALGQNTCLRYATGELVFFANDYTRFTPKLLERHWQIYKEEGPAVAILGPMVPMEGQLAFPPRRGDVPVVRNLEECVDGHVCWQFSFGRNDSAPLAKLLEVNGLDESFDGDRGGSDVDLAMRLHMNGCRLLVDTSPNVCFEYPHHGEKFPWDKKLPKKGYWDSVQKGWKPKAIWAPNPIDLRGVRV